jgi:hypothetical protein
MPSGRIPGADTTQAPDRAEQLRAEQLRALIAIHGDSDLDPDVDPETVDAPADDDQPYRGWRSGDQLNAA